MTRGACGCGEFCAGPGSSHKWGYASASLMRRRCIVLMCAVRAAICVTLNVSRDSSQPFYVGKSGVVGGISSGAVSGVFRNERPDLPWPLLLVWC